MSDSNDESGFVCPKPLPLYPNLSNLQQTVLVVALFALTGLVTVALLKFYDKMESTKSPPRWWTMLVKSWPLLGLLVYAPVGYQMHFVVWETQTCIVPPNGTWGWWYIPGSAEFHVKWTGVVEIVGGSALAIGGLLDGKTPWARPVRQKAALVLLALTVGMTFSNMYIITHGAWAFEFEEPFSVGFHFVRLCVQALWLSNLAYMAFHESLCGDHEKID